MGRGASEVLPLQGGCGESFRVMKGGGGHTMF